MGLPVRRVYPIEVPAPLEWPQQPVPAPFPQPQPATEPEPDEVPLPVEQ
jgi:hypothetical protein